MIRDRLTQDTSLGEKTRLSPDNLTHLLELCLRSTYFSFQGELYEQTEGAAMGSPVSPVVANTYMEYFEDLAMMTSPNSPRVWKWYVDDTFCILKKTAVLETLDHLNGIRPTMQFTIKEEKEGVFPFLDTQLNQGQDGILDVTVFRKKTHTDRYLQFESHLEGILQENGYPRPFIRKSLERRPQPDGGDEAQFKTCCKVSVLSGSFPSASVVY